MSPKGNRDKSLASIYLKWTFGASYPKTISALVMLDKELCPETKSAWICVKKIYFKTAYLSWRIYK